MPYGYGFGFRGASPPWPYVGRGRGGLPRCWYPGAFTAPHYVPGSVPPAPYGGAWSPPFFGAYPAGGAVPYATRMTQEQELDVLKEEAKAIKENLEGIEARIRELEAQKG